MTEPTATAPRLASSAEGHHVADGRNVAPGGSGLGGKEIFFAAVQMSRMPMVLVDPYQDDLPLVFVNQAFQRMTGYAEAEVLGRNCRFLQGPETDPQVVRQVRAAVAAREDTAVEMLNYRRDGTSFWNALYISPVFDAGGRLIYFFASQLDVTRRREREIVALQSQRMEALGSMASGVAHEFNNLMTVVVGSAQQALKHAVDEPQRKQLARIEWAARKAGRLTQQMLSFARRQFHDRKFADLNELVADLDSLLGKIVGGEVTVSIELAPEPLPVLLDAGQLELALVNLARNAADAMPAGGQVRIVTASSVIADARTWVVLTVADTGVGMTPEVLRKATEPFFTTKDRGQGVGLGLSMVAGFAAQSGGRLAIDSAPGRGTRVTMLLPRGLDDGSGG